MGTGLGSTPYTGAMLQPPLHQHQMQAESGQLARLKTPVVWGGLHTACACHTRPAGNMFMPLLPAAQVCGDEEAMWQSRADGPEPGAVQGPAATAVKKSNSVPIQCYVVPFVALLMLKTVASFDNDGTLSSSYFSFFYYILWLIFCCNTVFLSGFRPLNIDLLQGLSVNVTGHFSADCSLQVLKW